MPAGDSRAAALALAPSVPCRAAGRLPPGAAMMKARSTAPSTRPVFHTRQGADVRDRRALARLLGPAKREARRLLGRDAFSDRRDRNIGAVDRLTLARLRSQESRLLPWVRDTVHFQTAQIQDRTRAIAAELGRPRRWRRSAWPRSPTRPCAWRCCWSEHDRGRLAARLAGC